MIAKGERRPSEIAKAIGRNSAQDISPQLEMLRDLGLVLRETPITELRQSRSRNSLYWIADEYIDFWYRFVDPSQSLIARRLGERLREQTIAPALQDHISRPTFERTCRQYLWRALASGTLPSQLSFSDVGTWWGAGDREIDVVALDNVGKVTVFGSCKWTNAPADVSEYAALTADAGTAANFGLKSVDTGAWYILFSRSGFTDRLRELADSHDRLLLVTFADMYR